jgi:hypothetical protein
MCKILIIGMEFFQEPSRSDDHKFMVFPRIKDPIFQHERMRALRFFISVF